MLPHNIVIPASLYVSYDPALPAHCQDSDWDMVNYILNHKQGPPSEVQAAIWYFIGGGYYPQGPYAKAMVEDALDCGEGYVPPQDGLVALVVDFGPDKQTIVVEGEGGDIPVM
jgi:hypothetical protein